MLRLILVFLVGVLARAQEGDLYVLDLLDSGLKGESAQDTQGRLLREQNIKIIEHLGDHRYLYLVQRPSSVTRNRVLIEERKHVRHKFKFKYDVKGYNGLFIVAASIPAVDVLHKLIQASPRHRHQIYSISEDDHQTPPYYASPFVLRLKDPAYLNETIYQLTNLPCVLWFDLHRKHYKKDLFAQSVLLEKVNSIPPYVLPNPEVYNFPYKGKSQIVTVADTGIDLTHCAFKRKGITDPAVLKLTLTTSNSRALMQRFILASSFTQKIVGYLKVSFSDGTETYQTDFTDGPNGHGTHVTGLAAGASSECLPSTQEGTNLIRPFSEASIFFLDLENSNSSSQHLIVPPLITPFMEVSYQTGSRVFTNSWGAATCEYTVYAMEMDRFIYFHEDYIILVAAGNEGGAAYSVSSPGILKNGITVGSSQNTRESYLTYSKRGSFWEGGGSPDLSSADVLSKSYSEHNLADFSSRGPACDDRIKPDIVCPGEFLLSSRSLGGGKSPWLLMRGTSMATPLCAWAVTVVVEYFQQVHRLLHPSTALVKCALITTATTLQGTAQDLRRQVLEGGKVSSFRTKGTLDLYDQGFGRVNLQTILEGGIGFKEGSLTSYTGPPHKYCFLVQKTAEVSIGLTWSDPPAFVHSQHTLVNDLDLTVVWNNNITYYGNLGWDTDNTNNVERVRVHVEEDDYLEVYVSGPRVPLVHLRPKTSQGYALVYSSFLKPLPCKQTCDLNSPPYYASQDEVYPCKNNTGYSTTKHLLLDEHTVQKDPSSQPCCFRHVPCEIDTKKGIQMCDKETCTLSVCLPEYKIVMYPFLSHTKKRGVSRFLTALQDATTGGINLGLWGVIVGTAEVYLLVYFFLLRR